MPYAISRPLLSAVVFGAASIPLPLLAQEVIPDSTLGTESSIVTEVNATTDLIEGGALRNATLFHSFSEFGIADGHRVDFANPTGVNTIFSRVTGNNPSLLFGTLGVLGDADLVFINPNGVLFGPNAQLDLNGAFTVSTATSIAFPGGETFDAGNPGPAPLLTVNVQAPVGVVFEGSENPAAIINQADLAVANGQTLELSAGTIVNVGSLTAPNGTVRIETIEGNAPPAGLSTVDSNTLTNLGITEPFYGAELRQTNNGDLQLQGPGGYGLNDGDITASTIEFDGRTLVNQGSLDASGSEGGSIVTQSEYLVNQGEIRTDGSNGNGGVIAVNAEQRILQSANANTSATGTNGGQITLDANEGGSLLSGEVTAAGSTGTGGTVQILGESPNLAGTQVNASGDNGGGEILVGGDYQGQGDTPTAQDTVVNETAVLAADARINGDGGRVIVWADGTTRFGGEISARGGELGGDGGFVEVSGREGGVFVGFVDAGATLGEAGTLLLDPKNITIQDGGIGNDFFLTQTILKPTFRRLTVNKKDGVS